MAANVPFSAKTRLNNYYDEYLRAASTNAKFQNRQRHPQVSISANNHNRQSQRLD